MTKREEAIAAIERAICEPDNVLTSQQATAAFDAALRVMSEPSETMEEAGNAALSGNGLDNVEGDDSTVAFTAMLSTLRGEG